MPTAAGVTVVDVAVDVSVPGTVVKLIAFPAVLAELGVQVDTAAVGPHSENVTVPSGALVPLDTVAVSLNDCPSSTDPALACVVVPVPMIVAVVGTGGGGGGGGGVGALTVKHSLASMVPFTLSDAPV